MTYSLSVTGLVATHRFTVTTLTLSDANALAGGQQLAMSQGTPFLCQGPDGGQRLYKLDAERSTPSVPVLVRV